MFDWMGAAIAFFGFIALGIIVCMISCTAAWIENKIGFPAGLIAVFVSIAIMFALISGVGAI